MGFLNINGSDGSYPKEYLDHIKNETFKRMDAKGNNDSKVTVNEAYKDLDIGSMLSGLKKGSPEYNKLNGLTSNVLEILAKYAGKDGKFSPEEWAAFLNGNEWRAVIDTYHSSSNFAKIEMDWVDNSRNSINDGKVTKGEVKVGILNNLAGKNINVDTTGIEALIDKYAGDDGTFTVEEYMKLKNDKQYKEFLNKYNITPFES